MCHPGTKRKLPPVAATSREASRQAEVVTCIMSATQVSQSVSQAVIKSLTRRASKGSVCADRGSTRRKPAVLFHLGT